MYSLVMYTIIIPALTIWTWLRNKTATTYGVLLESTLFPLANRPEFAKGYLELWCSYVEWSIYNTYLYIYIDVCNIVIVHSIL